LLAWFMLILLAVGCLSAVLLTPAQVHAGGSARTLGLWHFDQVEPSGYYTVTPDAVNHNNGILGGDPSPALVEGKFGKALRFEGVNFVYVPISFLVGFPPSPEPIYIPISPSLNIQDEIRIDAWINVQEFTNASYNNIVVKCNRVDPSWENVTRVVGLAVRAYPSGEGMQASHGVLSGFVFTDREGFNEVVTSTPVVTLNRWMHVTFVRSSTGMHLYVDGHEQEANVVSGVRNPLGKIINGTEIYFGHDSKMTIDEVSITDLSPEALTAGAQIDIGPNLLVAIVTVAVVFAVAWLLRRAIQLWLVRQKP